MQYGIIIYVQSFLILFIGFFQIFPLAFSFYYDSNDIKALIYSIIINFFVGSLLNRLTRKYIKFERIKIRESFAIVSFGWIIAALFSSIPFMIHAYQLSYPDSGTINSFTDIYFEMISGLTTTGSSILNDIESLPKGLLFWRSLSHWLGGMGIILLAVAILPALEIGGMQLYQAEVPGPISDKIAPRISQTAQILWGVYLLFTFLETILLMLGGMSFFDSLCHSFGTVATGGFSTKNLSLGYYNSEYIHGVVTVFMFLAGTNFTLHYQFLKGDFKAYFKNKEFLFYLMVIIIATILIVFHTVNNQFNGSFRDSIHFVLFQVVSVLTTTGYAIGIDSNSQFHFGVWSSFSQFLLIIMMIMGGSAGSTSGGVKTLRVYLVLKFIYNEINKFISPRHIKLIRIGKETVADKIILSTLGFLMIHLCISIIAILIMNFLEGNLIESFSAVVATLNNIGPGLGKIGPDKNFAHISDSGKWLLIFCMLLGRLELYSLLILLIPITWKKS